MVKNNFIIFILLYYFSLYMDSLNVLIVFPFIIASNDVLFVHIYTLHDIMKYKSLFSSYYVFMVSE